jgi:hypothetical protein
MDICEFMMLSTFGITNLLKLCILGKYIKNKAKHFARPIFNCVQHAHKETKFDLCSVQKCSLSLAVVVVVNWNWQFPEAT